MNLSKLILLGSFVLAAPLSAQQETAQEPSSLDRAATASQQRLQQAVEDLDALREQILAEQMELAPKLNEKDAERRAVQDEFNSTKALLDGTTGNLTKLQRDIRVRNEELDYLSTLMMDFLSKFEERLHIAELQHYREAIQAARLAPDNADLDQNAVFEVQLAVVDQAIDRLGHVLGGYRFEGRAVNESSLLTPGSFALLGPVAVFRSEDGQSVGLAETRTGGSLEAYSVPFPDEEQNQSAAGVVAGTASMIPVDTTLGTAFKLELANKTTLEEIQDGGFVMIPIFIMASLALLIAVLKWISLLFVRNPSRRKVNALLEAVRQGEKKEALQIADTIAGPTGKMLASGAEHLGEPADLIEEVMYEDVLTTRLKVERFIPFVAICAASAPLLGLLGTVSGIINTFKMITVSGAGDVKSLSGGISEALITTKYGLIVAIPSLLLHAFLSRKARSVIANMERAAVAFVNQVSMTPAGRALLGAAAPITVESPAAGASAPADADQVRAQVNDILRDMLGPVFAEQPVKKEPVASAEQE